MPALSDKQQNFFKLVKAYKSKEIGDTDVTDKVKKVANAMKDVDIDNFVKESASDMFPGFNKHFQNLIQKSNTSVGDDTSTQDITPTPVDTTPSQNKTTYTGTPPLSAGNVSSDEPQIQPGSPRLMTHDDLINPKDSVNLPSVAKTIEMPNHMVKKFLYLIRDMSETVNEEQFNGKTVRLFKPFKIDHKTKKYGIYIKSQRDGQIIKVLFGDKDMIGDPLAKNKSNSVESPTD